MKKIFRKFGLSLTTLACMICAGVGVSLGLSNKTQSVKANEAKTIVNGDYYISGAGIRLVNDANGVGLRFHTHLSNAEYENLTGDYQTGTLIVPEIRYDGELTLDDMEKEEKYRPVNVDTTDVWYVSDEDGFMKTTAYLYNIPDKAYGARYVARSYIQYADGSVVYSYTSEDSWVSMSDIASTVTADAEQTAQVKAQVAPCIVKDTTVTYDMPDGQVMETVAYGAVATPDDNISYETSLYQINGWTDQYGRAWDIENDKVTLPLTLTPTFAMKSDVVVDSALGGEQSGENSPTTKYEGTDDTTVAPVGFKNVTRYDSNENWTRGVMTPAGYNNTSLTSYSEVWFAIKTNGAWNISDTTYASSDWVYFHLTQTATSVWTVEITMNGEVITLEKQSGTDRSYNSDAWERANAISTILYGQGYVSSCTDSGSVLINNGGIGETITLYATEVQANRPNLTGMPAAEAEGITDENGDQIWGLRDGADDDSTHEYTGEYTMVAPTGFTQVKRYDSNTETGDNGVAFTENRARASSYDDTDLSAYSEVWFAMNLSGAYFSDRTTTLAFGDTWVYFHLTQTSDFVWDVEVVVNGAIKTTFTGRNGATNTSAQPDNSIARILYYSGEAVDGVYIFMHYGTSCIIYTTEVKGILKDGVGEVVPEPEVEPNMPEVTGAITNGLNEVVYALGGTHSSNPLTKYEGADDTTTAPVGFEKVARFDTASAGNMWAAAWNNTDLTTYAYTEFYFALKIVGGTLKTPLGDKATDSWIYFHLTREQNDLWTIEIEINGEVYETQTNQSGTERNSVVGVQADNAISTILYGNYTGSTDKGWVLIDNTSGGTMTLYTTEIRVEIGERAVWAAFDGAVSSEQENATFLGFESFYKMTDFTPSKFAKFDLTDKGYTHVNFAFTIWAYNCSMDINGTSQTIQNGRAWYVTLTATEDGWNVVMDCQSSSFDVTYTFATTGKSLYKIFSGMTFKSVDGVTPSSATAYCTEVRAMHTVCSGGKATCTEPAICIYCGAEYEVAKGHGAIVWVDDVYQCEDCGEVYGNVNAELDNQDVVLFENATALTFNAQSANVVLDISGVTDLTISDTETQVTLGNDVYTGTIADGKVTFEVKPQDVFGEYTATFALTIEDKKFNISAPVLVITNQITTTAGLKAIKEVLRGADLTTATTAGIGGIGGENTMNGNGYYTLGADVEVNSAWGFYRGFAFGTPTVSFMGTFDGKGYALTGFANSQAALYGDVNAYQVNTGNESMNMYYESSLFGVMDGTIKNVALTNMAFGAYANVIHSGTGILQDVYLQINDLQHRADGSHIPLFVYGQNDAGTLRNVVFDFTEYSTSNPTANFDAATAKGIKAENVAVYGFLSDYKNKVYYNLSTSATTNGAEVGIYVTYSDGTNNGSAFTVSALNDELWTVVNGVPTFKKLAADAETVAPSTQEEEVGELGYYIAWDSDGAGAYDAAELIKSVTKTSTGKVLTDGATKPNEANRNQIIVGTYNEYMGYLSAVPTFNTNGCVNFGVYHVENGGNTIYVLADNEEGLMLAAKELCRKLFGYQVYSPDSVWIDGKNGIQIPSDFDYTSYIAFANRFEVNTMTEEEKLAVGLSRGAEYTPFIEMHNALNYLDELSVDKYGFALETYTDANVLSVDGPDDNNTTDGEQLCYLARGNKTSFDNLVARVVNVIIQRAKVDRRITSVNLMLEDNVDYCGCSACAKFSVSSIPHLIFLNEVAKKLQSNTEIVSRMIDVQFMAYASYGKAPVLTSSDITNLNSLKTTLGIDYETASFRYDTSVAYTPSSAEELTVLKAEENVRLLWTTWGANHSFGLTHEANDHMYESLQGWIASLGTDSIDAYMYQTVYRDYFLPLNTWKYQVEWYKTISALGLNSSISNLGDMYNDVGAQTAFGAFKTYINTRVMADVNVTYETLKAEFFAEDGYYGAGGPTMLNFFNELEMVMESKKQTSDYLDFTTFRWEGGGNTGTPYTDRRQAFLNGEYHYEFACVLFSDWTTTSGTLWQELYSGNGNTQQVNLERWYTYCQTAIEKVNGDETYTKRINVEQYFPEYAFLLLQTTYTVKTSSSEVMKKPSSDTITTTYQEFYDKVSAVIERPSEFYEYASTKTTDVYEGLTTWYEAYWSFFKTWGVTF